MNNKRITLFFFAFVLYLPRVVSTQTEFKITATDAAVGDGFGLSVSISGDYIVVGAPNDDDEGSNSGSAYVFKRNRTIWIQEAKLTASDAEGAGSMFRVTTLDLDNLPKAGDAVDYEEDFFGKPTFLTVIGQIEAEIFAQAMSDVYTFGPTFRAENSNTSRH